MPKQSRVKPMTEWLERLTALEDRVYQRIDVVGDAAQGQINQLKQNLDTTQRALLNVEQKCEQLKKDVGSDFQDQDDEIEKLRRQVQSIGDKLKAKTAEKGPYAQLYETVIKDLERKLTDANEQLRRLQDQELAYGHSMANERNAWQRQLENVRAERDAETERADRAEAELTGVRMALKEHLARPKPLFWGRFGELRKKKP